MNWKKGKLILVLVLSAMISGCSFFSGSYHYEPPNLTPPDISECTIEINQNIDDVWIAAILYFSDTFFHMDNILKDSYLVNLSFSLDNPNKFCDCGTIHGYIKNVKVKRDYIFPAASRYQVYELANKGQLYRVERKVSLSGKVNITFHELQNNHTKVQVKIKYVLTNDITAHNVVAQTMGQPLPPSHLDSTNYFTSTTLGTDSNQVICRSTLSLERSILYGINEYINR